MVASRKLGSPFNSGDLDPPSNPSNPSNLDTSPYWNDRGMVEKAKEKNVQDQFKKLGPPPPLPPIPKEPSPNPNTASSVTGKKNMSQIKKNLLRPV